MSPLKRALLQASDLRHQAHLSGDVAQARALHAAADEALDIGKRAARLKTLLEALAALASGSPRALRRWSLALWVLGARVKTLRAVRRSIHNRSAENGALS